MYNVIIVEDSKPILRNIKTLLDALDMPLRVVATATNGEEALEAIRHESIHILLTDIRMPKMDGLSLIEQVKQLHPNLKVVLISGYSDFEYTRKALNLQVFDYLLKPVDRKALEEVMARVIDQLNRQMPYDAELLKDIVAPELYANFKLGEDLSLVGQVMFVLRRQPFTGGGQQWGRETILYALTEYLAPYPCKAFPAQSSQQIIAFVNRAVLDRYSSLYECLESVRRHLSKQGMDVMIGGQLLTGESGRLPELYHRISGIIGEQQRINQGCALDTGNPVSLARSETGSMGIAPETDVVRMIQRNQKERFQLKLSELLVKWKENNVQLAELERFIGLLVDTFAHLLEERGSGIRLGLEARAKQLLEETNYADFGIAFMAWTGQCFDMLQSHSRKSREVLFEQIDEYMKMNRYSSLSINDLAVKFHVSPSYISRVIKNFTQSTFVQYYTGLKIKEACRLMESKPHMKFRELSDLLAFSDQHYFSKVFKEYTGFTPTEYKEHKREGSR